MFDDIADGFENGQLRVQLAWHRAKKHLRYYGVTLMVPSFLFLLNTALGIFVAPFVPGGVSLIFLFVDIVLTGIITVIAIPGVGIVDAVQDFPFIRKYKSEEIRTFLYVGNIAKLCVKITFPLVFAAFFAAKIHSSAFVFWLLAALWYAYLYFEVPPYKPKTPTSTPAPAAPAAAPVEKKGSKK